MREIKFRGKAELSIDELNDKEIPHNNGWVTGFYVDGWIVGGYAESEDEWIAFEWWAKVAPKTVGQFTGLKDNNGVEIYEGDILKAFKHNEAEFIAEIKCRHGSYWFSNWNWIEFQNIFRNIAVIGNIHDQEDSNENA